jgi:hypothetical protein
MPSIVNDVSAIFVETMHLRPKRNRNNFNNKIANQVAGQKNHKELDQKYVVAPPTTTLNTMEERITGQKCFACWLNGVEFGHKLLLFPESLKSLIKRAQAMLS